MATRNLFWNADTNTPTLSSGVGQPNIIYTVNVAGNTVLDGITSSKVGDQIYFESGEWKKVEVSSKSAVNIVYVDPVGGDDATADGTIGLQFKTLEGANAFITIASATNPFVISIAPGVINEASIVKKPYVSYIGSSLGSVIFTSASGFSLHPSHDTSIAHASEISNIILDGCDLNFNGQLYASGVWAINFNNVKTPNSKITLLNKTAQEYIFNDIDWYSTTTGDQTEIDGGTILMRSGRIYNYTGAATLESGASSLNILGGYINIFDLRTNSNCTALIANTRINTSLTLREIDGTQILNIDADSVPVSGISIVFLSGDGVPTINYLTNSSQINGSYTPANYPLVGTSIQRHLIGIDEAFGGNKGTQAISFSGITASPVSVDIEYCYTKTLVSLTIRNTLFSATASGTMVSTTNLPVSIRPTIDDVNFPIFIQDNGYSMSGHLHISTAGSVVISAGPDGVTPFTGVGPSGFFGFSVSYNI